MSQTAFQIQRKTAPAPNLQKKSNARSLSPPVPLPLAKKDSILQAKANPDFSWMKDNINLQAKPLRTSSFSSRQAIVQPQRNTSGYSLQTKNASMVLQAKLEIGRADDHYEREADRIADHVVSIPDSQVREHHQSTTRSTALQKKPIAQDPVQSRQTSSHVFRKAFTATPVITPLILQRQETNPSRAGPVAEQTNRDVETRLNASGNRGSPMSPETKTYFESRMDADFSQVRIHTQPDAVAMNNTLGSYAFTHGKDIYFNEGQYNPSTTSGRHLLAHELTHVVQQGAAIRRKSLLPGISRAPPSIQGFGISDIRRMVNNLALNIPGFQLVTTLIGYNFIIGEPVARTSANLILGFLRLVPPLGTALAAALQSSEKFREACTWIDGQVASLGISLESILAIMRRALDEFSVGDLLSPGAAIDRTINYFRPYFQRVVSFASSVFNRIVQFLRETVLRPLSNFARTLPGYPLLCVIMGRDPVTGETVPRSAENFVHGFMSLIPGGEEKWQQLQQSRAIPRTFEWLNEQVRSRNLTWNRIAGTFRTAWDSLSAADILHPIETIQRIVGIFRPLLADIVSFAISALEKILELIFEAAMGAGGARVLAILKRARSTFLVIIRNPVGFLGNLVNAVKQGIRQFASNILTHLREGLIQWLVGGLTSAGVQLPAQWDLRGILFFVLQILGVTYDRIRQKLVRLIGERAVGMLESGFELVRLLVTQGPMAAWQRILESIGNLRDMVLNGIRAWVQQRIVMAAITRLATLFNPIGAVIQAILGIYNTIMFFVERINQIISLVESVVNSISSIASGAIGAAANYIEQSMARTIPVILSFLSRLIGIGDIADPIRRVIQAIQARVDAALDRVVEWIRSAAQRLIQFGRDGVSGLVSWWTARKQFTTRTGESHAIHFSGQGASARMMLASDPVQISRWVATFDRTTLTETKRNALGRITQLLAEADRIQAVATPVPGSRTMDQVMEDMKVQIQLVLGDNVLPAAKAFTEFRAPTFKPAKLVRFIVNAEGVSESTANRRIRDWKGSGDLREQSTSPNDGYKSFSFSLPNSSRTVPDASRRQIFGFSDNVNKDSADGFIVMMKKFDDDKTIAENAGITRSTLTPLKRQKAWIEPNGWFYSARSGRSMQFKWSDAIMGHDDGSGHLGASGYWNQTGHRNALDDNRRWNRDPANYWGPEHRIESSASGSSAPRYDDPGPNKNPRSHLMWWHRGHAQWPGHRYSGYTLDFSAYFDLAGNSLS